MCRAVGLDERLKKKSYDMVSNVYQVRPVSFHVNDTRFDPSFIESTASYDVAGSM